MTTIEARAYTIIHKKYSGGDFELIRWATECCVEMATEQDRISRAEERERCIKAAQDAHCELCIAYNHCLISGDVGQPANSPRQCLDREEIREAIEKGGEE